MHLIFRSAKCSKKLSVWHLYWALTIFCCWAFTTTITMSTPPAGSWPAYYSALSRSVLGISAGWSQIKIAKWGKQKEPAVHGWYFQTFENGLICLVLLSKCLALPTRFNLGSAAAAKWPGKLNFQSSPLSPQWFPLRPLLKMYCILLRSSWNRREFNLGWTANKTKSTPLPLTSDFLRPDKCTATSSSSGGIELHIIMSAGIFKRKMLKTKMTFAMHKSDDE